MEPLESIEILSYICLLGGILYAIIVVISVTIMLHLISKAPYDPYDEGSPK